MSQTDTSGKQMNATHSTQIGSITGQVHTGSGDIIVKSFSVGNTISSKEDFLAVLQQFKNELEKTRKEGLNDDSADDVLAEVEAAEREANRETPKADRILDRLKKAQEILLASTGVATAATTVAVAIDRLLPYLESAVKVVSQIF